MPSLKLMSSDGKVFTVDVVVVKSFGIIKTMLEDLGMGDDEEEIIPLFKVDSGILRKIIQWATYHKDDPPPPEDFKVNMRTDDISTWDAEFMKVNHATIFELMVAANYLDIEGLMNLTCKTVASMMKGRNPEEIRGIFGLENDFTASEEEQLRLENAWCEEKSVEAANYLDIEGLMNLTCKTVASMMKGRNPEEIRGIFGLENDFTASEEEQLRLENAWCEEKSVEVIDLCDEDDD